MCTELDVEKQIVPVLSCVLSQIVMRNDKLALNPSQVTIFHALQRPTIGVAKYLERILKYAYCSNECFILALIYIDRLIQRNPQFVITSLNVHRLLVTSIMMAAKFFDDTYCNNAYYAKVGGVPCNEMNSLELEFLFLINFSLHVTPECFERYQSELVLHAVCSNERPCFCVPFLSAASVPPRQQPHPQAHFSVPVPAKCLPDPNAIEDVWKHCPMDVEST